MEPPLPLPKPPVCMPNPTESQRPGETKTPRPSSSSGIQQLVGGSQFIANSETLRMVLSVQAGGETSVPDLSKQYSGLCTFSFNYRTLYLNMDKY